MNEDTLKESLGDLAESVGNVDLYERSLAHSRRIGRNRATAGTAAALVAIGLAGWGLLGLPPPGRAGRPPMLASPTQPAPTRPSASHATTGAGPASPRSRSLAALPGRVFYRADDDHIVRLAGDGSRTTVLDGPADGVAISPGGDRIAYVVDGALMLAGPTPTRLYSGTVSSDQIPAWSSDGTRLLVRAPKPGVLTVATGGFAPLPSGLNGLNFRWSGDGNTLVYGTSSCRLEVAATGSSSGRTVPVIGDPESARNPELTAACQPLSVDAGGGRVTVALQSIGTGSGDPRSVADAVVDTTDGEVLPLPVTGSVRAVLFGPDDNLLIRTVDGGRATLSVLAPDGTLLVQAREPAALLNLSPVAYTR
jgi:TolB protein